MTDLSAGKPKRIEWIDIAKALGVILVVTGHFLYYTSYSRFNHIIYSFHLPFFFMLSGFVYRVPQKRFGVYIGEKSRRLLIPMSVFVGLMLPFAFMWKEYPSPEKFFERLFFLHGELVCNDPCWYFLVLFEIYIILFFAFKISQKLWYKAVLCLVCLASMTVMCFFGGRLVFGLDRAVLGIGFFLFGMLLKELKVFERMNLAVKIITAAVSFGVWLVFGIILNPKGSFYMFDLKNPLYFVLGALAACVWVALLCQLLAKLPSGFKSVCTWIGRNSVVIIGTHMFALKALQYSFKALHINKTPVYNFVIPLFVTGLFFLYVPVCKLINRHIPFLSVEKPRK